MSDSLPQTFSPLLPPTTPPKHRSTTAKRTKDLGLGLPARLSSQGLCPRTKPEPQFLFTTLFKISTALDSLIQYLKYDGISSLLYLPHQGSPDRANALIPAERSILSISLCLCPLHLNSVPSLFLFFPLMAPVASLSAHLCYRSPEGISRASACNIGTQS